MRIKDMITEDESNEKLILQQLLSLILSKMNENNKWQAEFQTPLKISFDLHKWH